MALMRAAANLGAGRGHCCRSSYQRVTRPLTLLRRPRAAWVFSASVSTVAVRGELHGRLFWLAPANCRAGHVPIDKKSVLPTGPHVLRVPERTFDVVAAPYRRQLATTSADRSANCGRHPCACLPRRARSCCGRHSSRRRGRCRPCCRDRPDRPRPLPCRRRRRG